MIGVQGTIPEQAGRPVMGYATLSPALLRPGDPYPRPIQSPRPGDPPVGVHSSADQRWPLPIPHNDPQQVVYGGPILETSERYPAVHGTEPAGLNRVDQWTELGVNHSWQPPQTGVYWGIQMPRAIPSDSDRRKPTFRMQFASWHDANQETRMNLGGHVVIRRMPGPTGLPGQTPYYQAPNTYRTGQPPRWDQSILIGQITPNG